MKLPLIPYIYYKLLLMIIAGCSSVALFIGCAEKKEKRICKQINPEIFCVNDYHRISVEFVRRHDSVFVYAINISDTLYKHNISLNYSTVGKNYSWNVSNFHQEEREIREYFIYSGNDSCMYTFRDALTLWRNDMDSIIHFMEENEIKQFRKSGMSISVQNYCNEWIRSVCPKPL